MAPRWGLMGSRSSDTHGSKAWRSCQPRHGVGRGRAGVGAHPRSPLLPGLRPLLVVPKHPHPDEVAALPGIPRDVERPSKQHHTLRHERRLTAEQEAALERILSLSAAGIAPETKVQLAVPACVPYAT